MALDEIPDRKWNRSEKKGQKTRGKVPMPDPKKELQSYYQRLELEEEEREFSPPQEEEPRQISLDSNF